jgi:hypothetical protein
MAIVKAVFLLSVQGEKVIAILLHPWKINKACADGIFATLKLLAFYPALYII